MAKNAKQARRPDAKQIAAQRQPKSGGSAAKRNAARRQQKRRAKSAQVGWIAAGVVLVAVAILIIVSVTGGNSPSTSTTTDAGRNPALAPSTVTAPLASIPQSVFDDAGVAGMGATLTVTTKQPKLTSDGLPRFVYEGGEFCPFCAMDRWPLVAALDRFGSFTGLKQIASSSTDKYPNIPTLSFYNSKYTSKYLVFTPYESEDINSQPLVSVPSDVSNLYSTYDAPSGAQGTRFDGGIGGIPFVDIANKYVSSGAPSAFSPVATALQHNAFTHAQIANALKAPKVAPGPAMSPKLLLGQANYITAAICNVDGNKPAAVCSSKGVAAAKTALAASKTVS